MVEGKSYRQSEVATLIDGATRMSAIDALSGLVRKGLVWRTYNGGRWEFIRLSVADLDSMQKRRADRSDVPEWMTNGSLSGYDRSLFVHARNPERTSYRA